MSNDKSKQMFTMVALCLLWYITSSSTNVIEKMVLSTFPYPMTVTMVQLTSITLYSGPLFSLWGIQKYSNIPWSYYLRLIVPLALGVFFSSVTSHISIWKVSVSYAHTVKATMPLFTVILMRIFFKEKQVTSVYLSIVPIIAGVAVATMTELSFDLSGLIYALLSTLGFSLQNILSKKVLQDTDIHHLRLLHVLSRLALILFLPVWLYIDFFEIIREPTITNGDYKVIALLFANGVLNWLQSIIAFSILSLCTPLTYAVASSSKRIFIIGASLLVLGNPVTWTNMFGMTLAIFGVLCYNQAKYFTKQKQSQLPTFFANQKHIGDIPYESMKGGPNFDRDANLHESKVPIKIRFWQRSKFV